MERGVLTAVAALRWAAWAWLLVVTASNLHRVDHPAAAIGAVAAMGAMSGIAQAALRRAGWRRAISRPIVAAEVVVAAGALALDGWVRQGRITGQSLAGSWPLAAILVVAVAGGAVWAAGTGALFGAARTVAVLVAGVPAGQRGRAATATASTTLLWIVVGAAAGVMVRIIRQNQDRLAEATVRERMASDLHDGVLQTLALIERRSPSAEIAQLARDQERELRSYLFGGMHQPDSLGAELHAVALRAERTWPELTIALTVTDDVPALPPAAVAAASGAATEALTNAAKHGHARRAVVFADIDEATAGLFLTVKDDGVGFAADQVVEGAGIAGSIRGRVDSVGGTVELASTPGEGTEVRMTIPVLPARRHRSG